MHLEKSTLWMSVREPIIDMLTMLEKTTPYLKTSMAVVKEGRILPTYAKATLAFPKDAMSEISWLTPTLASPSQSSRGGARTARVSQQPRSAMLVWAKDKVSREVPGLNMLIVRMLLRAEQRLLCSIREVQTKQEKSSMLHTAELA